MTAQCGKSVKMSAIVICEVSDAFYLLPQERLTIYCYFFYYYYCCTLLNPSLSLIFCLFLLLISFLLFPQVTMVMNLSWNSLQFTPVMITFLFLSTFLTFSHGVSVSLSPTPLAQQLTSGTSLVLFICHLPRLFIVHSCLDSK